MIYETPWCASVHHIIELTKHSSSSACFRTTVSFPVYFICLYFSLMFPMMVVRGTCEQREHFLLHLQLPAPPLPPRHYYSSPTAFSPCYLASSAHAFNPCLPKPLLPWFPAEALFFLLRSQDFFLVSPVPCIPVIHLPFPPSSLPLLLGEALSSRHYFVFP